MKLLFDLRATQPNLSGKRHGGGRYGEVIFFRMAENGIKFSCFYDSAKWLNPEVKKVTDEKGIPLIDIAGKKLQEIVDEGGFDRVYSCLLDAETSHLSNCEVYATIHGLRGLESKLNKCFWDYKNSLREQIKFILKWPVYGLWVEREKRRWRNVYVNTKAKLVEVSEHTKHSVLVYFPEMQGREMPVFYSPNTSTGSAEPVDRGERYFFCVSGNRWEKNNLRALEAFDRLLDCGLLSGVRMKVAGAQRDNFKHKFRHAEAFDFLGYVTDAELERLYAGAYLFVYPSLNEGFGYPPIEAMRYGVPVIASPLSSMAEVCDAGALYFNPFSVEEIMNRMLMMMDPERHAEFSARALAQHRKVSARQEHDLEAMIEYITK